MNLTRLIPPNPIQDWLITPIYTNNFIYVDHWSLVHFLAGCVLGYFLFRHWKIKRPWIALIMVLVGYEILEYFLGPLFFYPESIADVAWDLIIGFMGALFFRLAEKFAKIRA